ncbi:MAG: hypothetical protein EXS36_13345 [Pedosphaera sp.]|nr:hypothetical protein [Pedosphaera sp.]
MFATIDESILQRWRIWVHDQALNAPPHDPILEAIRTVGESVAATLFLGGILVAVLAVLACVAYRPRTSRGAIWLSFFGLFGGTPTLYLHTHPPSLFGFRLRRRHRRDRLR